MPSRKLFKVKGDINLAKKKQVDDSESIGEYDLEDDFISKNKEDPKQVEEALAWIRNMAKRRTQRII